VRDLCTYLILTGAVLCAGIVILRALVVLS
jgi:hypothetical protein